MKLSTDRILTTHAGSMPRGEPLGSMLIDQEEGKRIDRRKIDEVAAERVAHIVRKEVEVGITDGKKMEIVSGLAENDKVLSLKVGSMNRKNASNGGLSSPFGGGTRPPR